ncbi:chitin binding protein [Paenibacillus sp. JCM 10914]|nr:chitin binding protein [Paenibacillus sp. JCM 10914]
MMFQTRFILRLMLIGGGLLLVFACMFAFSKNVSAHGYINDPASRAIQCKNGLNTNCGPIIYEPRAWKG